MPAPPPSTPQELLIYGKQFGNVFIGVQPTFGYEGDPMRLLFSRSASPHHGFAAYYTFLEKIFQADAVLHFGTHGSLEFMPGKQVSGMEATLVCWVLGGGGTHKSLGVLGVGWMGAPTAPWSSCPESRSVAWRDMV